MQKVGKLNSSIDIIPIQESSSVCRLKYINRLKMEQRMFRDQSLIARVQTYMHENENKVYIDVNDMADALQKRYRDYRGKKRGTFRAMVRKAYDELTEIFSRKPTTRGEEYDDDDDDFEDVDVELDSQRTSLGDMLLHMYNKSSYTQNGNSSDSKELIDISSDDDVSKTESNKDKSEKDMKVPESTCNANQGSLHTSATVVSKTEIINSRLATSTPRPETTVTKPETSITKSETSITKPETHVTKTESVKSKNPINEATKQSLTEPTRKRQRDKENDGQFLFAKKAKSMPVTESKVTFSDVGGGDKILQTVCRLLAHIKHPEIFKQLGISPPRGFLLHGPPGCGKTLLAHAIAGEFNIPLLKVAGPELVTGVSGESEARIRELIEQALSLAPCIVFIDEIDAVAPHRATAQREMERRIVAQLLSSLDELNFKENGDRVLIIGATNRLDSLDPALRRAGRFDREVCLGIPDREARARILAVHTEKVILAPNVSLTTIASLTPGFVGADLVALIREAAMAAVERIFEDLNRSRQKQKSLEISSEINEKSSKKTPHASEDSENLINQNASVTTEVPTTSTTTTVQNDSAFLADVPKASTTLENTEMDIIQEQSSQSDLSNLLSWLRSELPLSPERLSILCIEHNDFETALHVVQPSAKREGFATVPDVTWDDVGSLQDVRQELQMAILAPIKHSEQFNALGLTAASGVLLCGPPGCGKTLLAKAIANETGINFISVKGPELLNMYVGESEKAVRQCFLRARNSAPCVIFFDELDALCPKRTEGDHSATSRVVNQMLTEMDGIEDRQGVFLMAASNRPDIIDPAILRPGRLDKTLYVGLPTASDRVDILRALTKNATKPKLASDVNLEQLGYHERCQGYTGADLAALIKEAGMEALKEIIAGYGHSEISMRHIFRAFDKVQPSVREKDIKHYEKLSKLYSVKKNSEITPMETPIDAPIVDVVMEPMET